MKTQEAGGWILCRSVDHRPRRCCRVGQVATAGSPTMGLLPNGAMVSSVM